MFQRVLIANRGEIARRITRTCRELGVGVAAVYSDADADALHVRDADVAVHLAGSTPSESYLDIERVIEAARRTEADAIHPGYGFLAENASFAQCCADAGITMIGPSPEAIRRMGSKTEAKRTMADAGVPLLPSAELAPSDDVVAAAQTVGYPLLVKASAGGGGKAMRLVHDETTLVEHVAACRREARAAFGDDTVFLERYLLGARHIEVQVFGDEHGQVFHLGERECSIQRRYQKVLEEAPSPAVDPPLREAMGAAAVAAAKAIDYVGAGTVEFLLDTDGGFYFLEMNTRLQVEHPVTELTTGLDLVRLQLIVAAGEPLPRELADLHIVGHAIEARLYAEDVAAGFLPASGTLARFTIPDRPGIRVDTGVGTGSEVSIHYDPLLAKVIAHRDSRAEAAAALAAALQHACVDGVTSNRDLLVGVLRHPAYCRGETTTAFLSEHSPTDLVKQGRREVAAAHPAYIVAAALAVVERGRATATVLRSIPAGFRSTPSIPQEVLLDDGDTTHSTRILTRHNGYDIELDGTTPNVSIHHSSPELVDISLDGVRRRLVVEFTPERLYVSGPEAVLPLSVRNRFAEPESRVEAGSLVAPMPGTAIRVGVEVGSRVAKGDSLVVLEAMKMEHTITAAGPATVVAVKVSPGDQVDAGEVLVVLEDDLDEAGN
ncbi:biotin carboxylase N-terminal domain-containing protein [Mycolicibacterium holsaticum]|uniref:Biotin-dependent 3-methylcrotonyl-coenzyme A carboxylase alpha1 subunit n=1 Tax=Mycolicibacterium holsaticum TaxID=152142 RepID=A0A1E3RVD3_9MYCO|nr:biotin carboxylase N-terminal domain-containing protein [Mycolicibacterium holsaticum]ODQ93814.1 acetyl/propionyl-CoA carboxylase subuit alpha [Mycolicibacterium holsaticum]